jgi:hypothetical protein
MMRQEKERANDERHNGVGGAPQKERLKDESMTI